MRWLGVAVRKRRGRVVATWDAVACIARAEAQRRVAPRDEPLGEGARPAKVAQEQRVVFHHNRCPSPTQTSCYLSCLTHLVQQAQLENGEQRSWLFSSFALSQCHLRS